jgi:TetR/AcrR family transcriptional regulator, lmrAB and yxaGH operons repressor
MSETRARILLTMARLMEIQGYHATGLNEIIHESGAPKGSLYYYFPDGKEQIGSEAILESSKIITRRLREILVQIPEPAEAVYRFLLGLADNVEASGFAAGSPLTTATIETSFTSEPINLACREAFDLILRVFEEKFLTGGFSTTDAAELALYVTTVVEGGILMSRTYHRAEPLRLAAKHLKAYLASL